MEQQYYTPTSWDEVKTGMHCEVKPINPNYDWKPGVLRYNPGYEDKSNPKSLYNLSPFWYTMRHDEHKYGPIIIKVISLDNIRIPLPQNSESLVDKMRPLQILFNRRQAGDKLTDEENAILDGGFPVQQTYNEFIKAIDEYEHKSYIKPNLFKRLFKLLNIKKWH